MREGGDEEVAHPPERRAAGILRAAGAVVLAVVAILPAMKVGFLADDFYIVRRIAAIADANPGLVAQLREGVLVFRKWSAEFQAFRPLTIATLQLDWALHGVDARGFRATNIALWILCAWLFSAVCRAYLGVASPGGRIATFLACAWWPVAVEPIAWTVIRQDSLLAASALLGALLLRRKRRHPWLVTLPLLAALASKETAIVLPFAFAAIDAALLRREDVPKGRILGAVARRAWPWFLAVAVWWFARQSGAGGGVWGGKSYSDVLFSAGTPSRIALGIVSGLRALVLPVNFGRGGVIGPVVLASLSGVLAMVAIVVALRRARAADLAAGAVWLLGPLLLLAPFYVVTPALESVRVMVLPGLAWLFAVVSGAAHIARRRPRFVLAATLVFVAAEALVLRFDLGAWISASARVERICFDAREWTEGTVYVLRAREQGSFLPSLLIHEGVYVFSTIEDPLGPPFLPARIRLVPLEEQDERRLSALVASDADRGMIAAVVQDASGPRFRLLLDRAIGLPMTLVPPHGTTVRRADSPVFLVTLPQRGVEPGDVCIVVVADPTGNRLEASRIITAEDLRAGARIPFGARDFGMTAAETPLARVDAPVFLCSAALFRGDVTIARTAYAVVNIADDG